MRAAAIVLAALSLWGCDNRPACGDVVCGVDQLCILPAESCLRRVGSEPCPETCTTDLGEAGCFREYATGACIDIPDACGPSPDCTCLETAIDEALAPREPRCVDVDARGWIVVSFPR